MRQPGVEPGAKAWEASMLPIHHWRSLDEGHKSRRGGAGFRSLCLPIANRPLYRVSYTPVTEGTRDHPGPLTKSLVQAMGFEPMPLARLAPKASALTTRPNLQPHASQVGGAQTPRCRAKTTKKLVIPQSPWGDSNPQPPDPKSDALSIAPQGQTWKDCRWVHKKLSTTVGFEPTRAKPINLAG